MITEGKKMSDINYNTGNNNTGNNNTGCYNTGDNNAGNWNSSSSVSGYFNTESLKTIRVFNKECSVKEWGNASKPGFLFFNLTEFVSFDNMTDAEKEQNPNHKTTGGYLKTYEYKEAFKKSYESASQEERDLILKLPNFDPEVFLEISGIDVRVDSELQEKKRLMIEKANELLKQAEEL